MERQSIAGSDLQLNTNAGGGGGGSATAANQVTQITAEQAIQVSVASIDTKTPTSPATSAKQDTGNTALTSIATSVGDIDTATGTKADVAWVSGDGTIIAILKAIAGGGADLTTLVNNEATNGLNTPVANDWAVHHVPATNTKATITQASAGAGNRNICRGLTCTIATDATAPTVTAPLNVSLIDGASGGSTYLWRSIIAIPGVPGAQITIIKTFSKPIKGSQATAMTLEFSAAGGADTYESVSMDGSFVTE